MSKSVKKPSKNQAYSLNRYRYSAITEKFSTQLSHLPSAEGTPGVTKFDQTSSSACLPANCIDGEATQPDGTNAKHKPRPAPEIDAKAMQAILTYALGAYTGRRQDSISQLMFSVVQQLGHSSIEQTAHYIGKCRHKPAPLSANRKCFEEVVRSFMTALESEGFEPSHSPIRNDKESK